MYAIAQGEAFVGALCQSNALGCEVEKEGRRLGELLEGSAFGEMAVLGLMSSQSATIKVEKRIKKRQVAPGGAHVRLAIPELLRDLPHF